MRHGVVTKTIQMKHGDPREFVLFDTKLCPTIVREVLNGVSYPLLPEDVLPADSVTRIVDVGSHIGASCVFWCDCYPNATVRAFEPCIDAYTLLVANTTHDKVETFNIALGSEDGFVDLYHSVEDDCCNSLTPHKHIGHEKVVIERARKHINEPCDILKLDAEGAELAILSDIEAWLCDIKVIYLETHSEHDRIAANVLLKGTHTLWCSHSERPHRCEHCFVRTPLIPEFYMKWAIR